MNYIKLLLIFIFPTIGLTQGSENKLDYRLGNYSYNPCLENDQRSGYGKFELIKYHALSKNHFDLEVDEETCKTIIDSTNLELPELKPSNNLYTVICDLKLRFTKKKFFSKKVTYYKTEISYQVSRTSSLEDAKNDLYSIPVDFCGAEREIYEVLQSLR